MALSSLAAGRRTKIVCTIGPATFAEDRLQALLDAGMDVARLNFSHGTPEDHVQVIARLRRLAGARGAPLAILQDLAGPKVRIGTFAAGSVELVPGEPFTLTTRPVAGDAQAVSVSYADLPRDVHEGDTLLLADGTIELRVEAVAGPDIRCRVTVGGTLGSRKGINVPSGLMGLPILGDRDRTALRVGAEQKVDYVGVSFVRTADDLRTVREALAACGAETPLVAKIETQAALTHFDDILAAADGIMIARGDLAIETPFARVPAVQKILIARANRAAKTAITATQMLYSMVTAPHPTRAEVADVANAVLDGSDALMLSEETAVGAHPVRAVETMAAIARETEGSGVTSRVHVPSAGDALEPAEALALAACELATRLGVDVITTLTEDGRTARLVAKYRPAQPIVAVTPRPETFRRLALVRGVAPLLLPSGVTGRDEMARAARDLARERGWTGARAVFVASDAVRQGVL